MDTKIFISYSHGDAKYLKPNSLLGYLQGLKKDHVKFWHDEKIKAGENWNDKIKNEIDMADIALVLVSQMFLNSKFCTNKEVRLFLQRHRESALIVFPVILSPCDWKRYSWIKNRQFLPGGDKTIEEHFGTPGKRKRIFLNILKALREEVKAVNSARKKSTKPLAMKSTSKAINTLNKMVPEIKSFHYDKPEDHKSYGLMFEGNGKVISAVRNGQTIKTITAKDLNNLSPRQLGHINFFQTLLDRNYKKWKRLYEKRQLEVDSTKKKMLNHDIREIVADMKESLDQIFSFLKSAGLEIDDHYLEFRHAIEMESRVAEKNNTSTS